LTVHQAFQHASSTLHPRSAAVPPPLSREALAAARLEINGGLDVDEIARQFADGGRVRIPGLLGSGALELHDHLQESPDWIHLITGSAGVVELDARARRELGEQGLEALKAEAQFGARDGFRYSYEAISVPEPAEAADQWDLIQRFAQLMAGDETRSFLGRIIGEQVGAFADGQATAYGPGDFLTLHDDAVEGKDRLAAFVFGLTPGWRIDWGGLLHFHEDQGRAADALVPRFNTLDLFAVPREHSVSLVTSAAAHRRYAVTGWLTRP
jgi:hypothetical protein